VVIARNNNTIIMYSSTQQQFILFEKQSEIKLGSSCLSTEVHRANASAKLDSLPSPSQGSQRADQPQTFPQHHLFERKHVASKTRQKIRVFPSSSIKEQWFYD